MPRGVIGFTDDGQPIVVDPRPKWPEAMMVAIIILFIIGVGVAII